MKYSKKVSDTQKNWLEPADGLKKKKKLRRPADRERERERGGGANG